MYQKSGKIEHMYNNQTSQQRQPELKTGINDYRAQNPYQESQIRITNREIFMQGGTNSIIKDHQKSKIFDTQNSSQPIKNFNIVSRFPSQIPNSPQCDRQNPKPNEYTNKSYTTNVNGKPQMPYNNQQNNSHYYKQGNIVKTEQLPDMNETVPINHKLFSDDAALQMESKFQTCSSLEQNKKSDQQQMGNQINFYDQLVEQQGQIQEVLIEPTFQDQEKQNQEQVIPEYAAQSIIISQLSLMELKNRDISSMKNFERTIGIRKSENQKESPIKQHIQIEQIQSDPIMIQQSNTLNQSKVAADQLKGQKEENCQNNLCETINLVKFNEDEETNMENPEKISNFVTTKIQQRGEKCINYNQLELQSFKQISQPSQRCSALEFEVLERMNQVRQNRLEGMKVDYFGAVERLEKSDCLSDLAAEKSIIQLIVTQFPYLRRVRGDGNCLFSSLLFPYLELIYINNLFDTVLNQFVAHEIYWNKATMIDRPMVFTLIKKIFQELKKLSKKYNNDLLMFSEVILHYINRVNGFYDMLIIFMRSTIIQSYKLYSKQGEYQNFLDESTSEEFLERNSSFEEEGDFLSIQFFCEITQLKVKLINFSDKHPIQSMQTLEPKLNKVRNDQANFISLKYNEGHYDILYSRMLKQMQIKQEERPLPEIQFTALY
ncbi:unnamed protein product (macronuclear) [Paramecium tetraurelia]|uniref:ubiquitinyl hydrolase 1 n=1 Tax=Paramecium tetraurelia TaxID=5888 RepID=A0BQT7_PARTE|nr:uncharacterized protein GSPATT00031133001 [Paramecium tetraurelia]CAK60904.1 unnamed protein product [Paramecium tetraurelia]|eukprot:XP_001428302.1 hypothetical protein (macronuclear) [Paramecium tetraurelia strain d4-2]